MLVETLLFTVNLYSSLISLLRYEYVVNDYYVTHEWRLIEYLLKLADVSVLLFPPAF